MTDTPSNDRSGPSVLVVEDEPGLADLYTTWLAEAYDVRTAYRGEEALSLLDESVDVVLLDRRMPGISGDDVLDEIRSKGLDCRVVIVSAVTPEFDVIGMGFDDYLVKPVSEAELHDTVERMLTRATYDDAVQEYQQLVATRAALEAQHSESELRASEEYRELLEAIEERQSEADDALTDFKSEDFNATFRKLDRSSRDRRHDDPWESEE